MALTEWGADLMVRVSSVDVSCDVVEIDMNRGKVQVWQPMEAATCLLVIDASDQGQPPSRGPLGAVVTVAVTYGPSSRTIFTGKVQQRRLEAAVTGSLIYLDCVDAFEQLGRVTPLADFGDVPPVGSSGETVQSRIGRWLDIGGFTGTRRLDASTYNCPAIVIGENGDSVLGNIKRTALADGGDFFIDGDGAAVFKSWTFRDNVHVSDATFSDRQGADWVCYSSATYREDLDEVQNNVHGARRPTDSADHPVVAVISNDSSISTYGQRGDPLINLELVSDPQVASRVGSVVSAAAQPEARFDPVVVQPAINPARSWPKVLAVHWGSLVAVNRIWPNGTPAAKYGWVMGERWRITAHDCTITYRLSSLLTYSTAQPAIPPDEECIVITPEGCVCLKDGCVINFTDDVVFYDVNGTEILRAPPGSLCYCSAGCCLQLPDGADSVGYDNGSGTVVKIPITKPQLKALLWFDVNDPGPGLIERIDNDIVPHGAAFASTRLDVIPGNLDAIDANSVGGPIGSQVSSRINATNFDGGWSVDFWLFLTTHLGGDTEINIIDLDTVKIILTTKYQTTGPYITQLEVAVKGTDVRSAAQGGGGTSPHAASGPLADLTTGSWDHWIIEWDPNGGTTQQGAVTVQKNGVIQ